MILVFYIMDLNFFCLCVSEEMIVPNAVLLFWTELITISHGSITAELFELAFHCIWQKLKRKNTQGCPLCWAKPVLIFQALHESRITTRQHALISVLKWEGGTCIIKFGCVDTSNNGSSWIKYPVFRLEIQKTVGVQIHGISLRLYSVK